MDSILSISGLSFQDMIYYPDLQIETNQPTFITGPSGSGKSTLLRLFNGTLTQSSGEIYYNGKDTMQLDTIQLRKEILLVGQSVFLFEKSIRENFMEYYRYREEKAPSDEQMRSILEICCVDFPLEKDCTSMSGGEKQRVYIAIFLSFLPKILMLDEPTSALDAHNGFQLMNNLLAFCKEKQITTIVVSHDGSLTQQFAHSVFTIQKEERTCRV